MNDGSKPPRGRDHAGPVIMMLLHGRLLVPQALFEGVRAQVEEVLPALRPGVPYTAKMLCGKEFWGQLTRAECIMAGRCLAHMVVMGLLPLQFAGSKACSKQYQLK